MLKKSGLVSLLLLTACPSEPVATPPKEPTAEAPPRVAAPEPELDMSPVPTPKSLVLVLRASRPKQTLDAAQKLGKLPFSIEEALKEASKGASPYFDLAESFDLAVGLDPMTAGFDDPRFFFAFSIPLQRGTYEGLLDLVEKEGDEVRKAGKGHYRIRSKGMSCEVAAPDNVVPRLVCGDTVAAYRELGPWMYRTLATQPKPASDLALRIDFGPMREEFLPTLRKELDEGLGDARSALDALQIRDPELLDAPSAAAKELTAFLEELDHMEASLSVDANKPDAVLKSELFFRGNQSWATKVLTVSSGPPAPAPDVFWRLPKDADVAFFGHSADPSLFTTVRRVGKKALAEGLKFAQLEKADSDAIVALFDALPIAKGVWTVASGELATTTAAVKPEAFKPENAIAEMKNKTRGLTGWNLFASEGDIGQMTTFMKQSADVYARGVKIIKKKADDEVARASGESKKWAQERRARMEARMPKLKFTANPPGLPKGSAALDLDIAFTSKDAWSLTHPTKDFGARPAHPAKEVKGNVVIRFLAVPDEGGRYVFGFSADGDALKEKILASLKSGKPELQLSSRTDLARLKAPLRAGGFASIGRIVRGFARFDDKDHDAREVLEIMAMLPNKGMGPMFFTAGGAAGATPTLSSEALLDKAWVEDIGAIVGLAIQDRSGRSSSSKPPAARP